MPIYAYKCESCGHAKDVLQKMSDPVLTVCPSCGQSTFSKQVTAAGFQLKGSGWYVTDFRDGGSATAGKPESAGASSATPASSAPATGGSSDSAAGSAAAAPAKSGPATPAAASPAASSGTPAAGSGA